MAAQSIEEAVVSKLRELPSDKQQEVLDFANFLGTKSPRPKLKSVKGLCAERGIAVSEKDDEEGFGPFKTHAEFLTSLHAEAVKVNNEEK